MPSGRRVLFRADRLAVAVFAPEDIDAAEIGYSLDRHHTGKGYCLEAVLSLCEYLRGCHIAVEQGGEVDKDNEVPGSALRCWRARRCWACIWRQCW